MGIFTRTTREREQKNALRLENRMCKMFIIKRKNEILTVFKSVERVNFDKISGRVEFVFENGEFLNIKIKSESGDSLENAIIRAFSTNETFVETWETR